MSSLRVRAQNKLLEKLGATKPSKNIQFDVAHANFEKAHANVQALDGALRGFIVSLRAFHISAQVLYGAVESMGGSPESSPEMKQSVAELKTAFQAVDVTALNDAVKRFEQRVLRPSSGWLARADALKAQVATFNEEKLVFDHYTRKVMTLREARDKRAAGGKSEKPKDVEKLVRNEQKLAGATNTYTKISEKTITDLREFVNTREQALAPIVQRIAEFRASYAAQVADESQRMAAFAKQHSQSDGVLGALESLAARVTGSFRRDGGAPAGAPEEPVQTLSFATFVGDSDAGHANADADADSARSAIPFAVPAPPDMPALPAVRPPPPPALPGDMPALPVVKSVPPPPPLLEPSAPFGHAGFADNAAFQTAPALASPSSPAGFTPWDDFAMPPSPPPFQTLPTSPSSAEPPTNGWDDDAFGFSQSFQAMHMNARPPS
ncbi:hypothetical protein P43SY_009657 [Pythium insidiosum]|uniref:BAR domain-containing protein n=1 Tax=Pythium insidiosum TaxID=114742 RepID=A0AAD5LTU2_PYTIN|nr:hypothetical protein P43SY_009657 [Pythium insidiosum]KAJ0398038.1 hypothetical protein ATCC90586_005237 [Pythium insidiosum]